MQLSQLTPGIVERAVAIYVDLAYERATPRTKIADELDYTQGIEPLLGQFLDEARDVVGRRLARHALRLGNDRYPFMKFVVQEFLQDDDFYFVVDTHDEMKLSPDTPGFDEFQEIRHYNRELKETIEGAWLEAGVPTILALEETLAATAAAAREAGEPRANVLVVDDDSTLAAIMGAILQKHGFAVVSASNGRKALDRLQDATFDLIICDYQMPVMDGADLVEALRERDDTRETPVLLATAAPLSLADITDKANGFLVKPYREEVLIGLIGNLLDEGASGAA